MPLISSASDAGSASARVSSSSLIAGGGLLFAVLACPLSLVISVGLLSTISGRLSSSVAGVSPSSTVFGHFSPCITRGGLLSTIFSGGPTFFVPFAGSQALFLTSIPSRTRYFSLLSSPLFQSSLSSLPIPLACNPIP